MQFPCLIKLVDFLVPKMNYFIKSFFHPSAYTFTYLEQNWLHIFQFHLLLKIEKNVGFLLRSHKMSQMVWLRLTKSFLKAENYICQPNVNLNFQTQEKFQEPTIIGSSCNTHFFFVKVKCREGRIQDTFNCI